MSSAGPWDRAKERAAGKVARLKRPTKVTAIMRRPRSQTLATAWLLGGGLVCGAAAVYAWHDVPSSHSGKTSKLQLCSWAVQQSCVVDGDTIRFDGVKIRLSDIDTPEIGSPKCASEAALGHRAKERLLELLNAGPFQVVQRGSRDEDSYGRKLRVIERAGRSLGETLVAEGLARPWDGARRSWC